MPKEKLPPVLSWERIRLVFQEQDKLGIRDNMFVMEALCKTQREIDIAFYEKELAKTASAVRGETDDKWIAFLNKCFKRAKSLTITGKSGKGFTQITMPSEDFEALKGKTEKE